MATLTMIKWFVEGNDLVKELQTDAQDIEGQATTVAAGWDDLNFGVLKNPDFTDILNSGYSTAKDKITQTTGDAETYMKSVTIQVQRPNYQPGISDSKYINLYAGNASKDSDGDIDENLTDTTFDSWGDATENAATLWEVFTNSTLNLVTMWEDCYYDNAGGPSPGLGVKWASSGQINLRCNMWDDSPTDNGCYCAAQGSFTQWAPFVHLTGGDPTALNADVFLA